VFLMDEPLSNLDAKLRSELRVEIKLLHRRLQNTMIYVTHDQVEAMTLADRIAVMKGGVIQQLDAPQTIYNRPVNRFVAGFLGSPAMNFIDGRLEKDGGDWHFAVEDVRIPLGTYAFEKEPAPGPAVFGIRPEHVAFNSGTGWPFAATANVEVVEPMGSDTLVWLKLGGQNFTVRVTSERTPKNGDPISVGFDPMRASLFDAQTGNRI
ncbi:MAG: TOBE domain-containing protein, partial [Mesorhizobium sp.]